MKNIILTLLFLASTSLFVSTTSYCRSSEQLDPKLLQFLKENQQADLNANAFIALAALSNDNQNNIEATKKLYKKYKKSVVLKQPFDLMQLKPTLPFDNELFESIDLAPEGHILALQEHRQKITVIIKQWQPALQKFRALAELNNYQHLKLELMYELDDVLRQMNSLATFEILYLIEQSQLKLAATHLGHLIAINHKAMRQNSYLAHSSFFYQLETLILELLKSNNTHWQPIIKQLQPLPFTTVNGQEKNKTNYSTFLSHVGAMLVLEDITATTILVYDQDNSEISLIEELNDTFTAFQTVLINAKNRNDLFNTLQTYKPKKQKIDITKGMIHILYSYYDHFWVTLKSDLSNIINIDLINQLIRLIIAGQNRNINQLIEQPQWHNPYTNKPAFIINKQVCYQSFRNENICVNLLN